MTTTIRIQCPDCEGTGELICCLCSGTGTSGPESNVCCRGCGGGGLVTCETCEGEGEVDVDPDELELY